MNQTLSRVLCLGVGLLLLTSAACSAVLPAAQIMAAGASSNKQPSGELSGYGAALAQGLPAISGAAGAYAQLLQAPGEGSNNWMLAFTMRSEAIDLAYAVLVAIKPPADLASLHAAVVNAATDCKEAKDTAMNAVSGGDPAGLPGAALLAISCATKVEQAKTPLLDYLNSKGVNMMALASSDRSVASGQGVTAGQSAVPASISGAAGTAIPSASMVNSAANLRAGPGTDYARIGAVYQGAAVTVTGRNAAGDWLAVTTATGAQAWIAAFLVDGAPEGRSLPVVAAPLKGG